MFNLAYVLYHSLTVFMQSLYFCSLSETMPKCSVVWEVTWQNVHHKQSVLLQGHTAFLVLLLYCAVLLNAKLYALSDDVACC